MTIGITSGQLNKIFPFHVAFDADMKLLQFGGSIAKLCPDIQPGKAWGDFFRIVRPRPIYDIPTLKKYPNTLFVVECAGRDISLKGEILFLEDSNTWLFLASPIIRSVSALGDLGIGLNDFAQYDSIIDFLFLMQSQEKSLKEIQTYSQQLKQSHDELDRLKRCLDEAEDGVFLFEADTLKFFYVNRGALWQTGYSTEELLSMTPVQIKPEYDDAAFRAMLEPVLHGDNHALKFETVHRHKDGTQLPVEIGLQYITGTGEHKGYFIAIVRDITERKKLEAELRISAVAFESKDILMITDASGVILRVNKAFTENTGYSAEEIIGQTPSKLKSGRHDAAFYREMWDTITRTGRWEGEIWDRRKNGEIYPKWLSISAVKSAEGVVTHYVASHVDITERKNAENEIRNLAFFDPLTGLPNRRLLMDRLQQAMASSARSGRKCGLLFIDLDNFKTLNDTLGHDIGDLLLNQVGKLIATCVREGDTIARLGGDEFVLVLEDLSEGASEAAEQAESVARKVISALNQPHRIQSHECRSTPSIGITLFSGHTVPLEELMKQADIAMYQAKKAGRNTLCFFDWRMQISVQEHAALENDLRQAINLGQFQLYYQVQVGSAQRVMGAEALIRWMHPRRGMISPGEFIPLAEETELILPLGQWILDTACARIRSWQQSVLTRNTVLAVNVSAIQFRQKKFVPQLQSTMKKHRVDPRLLKLELTEGLLLDDIEGTISTMTALKKIGVRLSLDDFGTGYSSLQYLKRLPLDQLKIDHAFVRDLAVDDNDKAIIRTIIAMAHTMDLEVIAEGVETEEQRQILMDMGCHNFQGYLFSKPLPAAQYESFLMPD